MFMSTYTLIKSHLQHTQFDFRKSSYPNLYQNYMIQFGALKKKCSCYFNSLYQELEVFSSLFVNWKNVLVVSITLIFSDLSGRVCCLEDFHDSAWCPFVSDVIALALKTELDCICRARRKKNKAKK